MQGLQEKVVLITGAAKGMGATEAKMAAERGATVIVTDVLDEQGLEVAESIGSDYFHLDVSDKKNWAEVINSTVEKFGRIDGLVNNCLLYTSPSPRD